MYRHRLLYTSADIHRQIKRLFGHPSPGDRRVALVAYVGTDAAKYLPHPKGLRLICNLSAGGTDPDSLRQLIARGANVEVSDSLHMKVYWSKSRGCVICSANASSSALGRDGLKESGIWLPSGAVDVKRLVRYSDPRKIGLSDLRRLDRETREYERNSSKRQMKAKFDFSCWYSSPHRSVWKLGYSGKEVYGYAKAVREQSYIEYGHKEPYTWISCRKGKVQKGDWLLTFAESERGIKSLQWLYVDFLVKVSPRDKRYYDKACPYHAVQVNSPSKYPTPPFSITPQFRSALGAAVRKYTGERILNARTDIPGRRFLRIVEEKYRRQDNDDRI